MAILVNSGISSSLARENVRGNATDLVFRRTDLLNWLRSIGATSTTGGAQPLQWNVVTAANSSAETFVEGQAAPVAGRQTYARASQAPTYFRVVAGYSGHVLDQQRNGGTYDDPVADAIERGTADLMKKIEDSLVGTTQDVGIQSIIDSDDTYAGLAPGSYNAWASKETGSVGTLGVDDLEDLQAALAMSPYLSDPDTILCAHTMIQNYTATVGPSAGTSLFRINAGQKFDAGVLGGSMLAQGTVSFNGMPFVGISGLTNTVLLMLDSKSGIELVVHRDVEVQELARTSDDQNFQITMACMLRVQRRNAHGKLTGITA